VRIRVKLRDIPGRVSTGAFILHSGLDKIRADEETAKGVHGMASGAFPSFSEVPPSLFVRFLAVSEIATGVALLNPFVSSAVAGAALTGFSGSLLAMYWRTEVLHKPGSIWPTQAGIGVSKDIWMLGIGVGLLVSSVSGGKKHQHK
jgi:uncharacterized membrane protein YphA (DoxX/SURF4 family)